MGCPAFATPAPPTFLRPLLNHATTSPHRARRARCARIAPRLCAEREEPAKRTGADSSADQFKLQVRLSPPDDTDVRAAAFSVWFAVSAEAGIKPSADVWSADLNTEICVAYSKGRAIGAGRLLRDAENARLEMICVLSDYRGRGVGRRITEALLSAASTTPGAVYVRARADELGFYSLLGFEAQGGDAMFEEGSRRVMVYRWPVCATSAGCVGLHHTSIRVSDIERSLAFYGCLGFFVTEKFMTAGGTRACFVEGLGARLEFVEAPDGRGGLAGMQGIPPAGFDRLVFDVTKACTDLDGYLLHLARRNGGFLTVAAPPARQVIGNFVVSVATIEDVDGLPIEFIRREASLPSALRTRVDW